ncbi:MAG: hypothetical protein M3Q75_04240 [Gemmatimonadota bacterium]|nr:hypothetical protein [Gemmatimonadota bacterium]
MKALAKEMGVYVQVEWGDALIIPRVGPRTPLTRRQRLADWWEWSAKERWFDARYWLGDRLEHLSRKVKP